MNWYLDVLKKYATFSGRARRKEYWFFALFSFMISIIVSMIDIFIGAPVLQIIYGLAVLIPGLAVSIRRLHDTNRSGWWLLIILVPFVGAIALLAFMSIKGEKGKNRYGDDPLLTEWKD